MPSHTTYLWSLVTFPPMYFSSFLPPHIESGLFDVCLDFASTLDWSYCLLTPSLCFPCGIQRGDLNIYQIGLPLSNTCRQLPIDLQERSNSLAFTICDFLVCLASWYFPVYFLAPLPCHLSILSSCQYCAVRKLTVFCFHASAWNIIHSSSVCLLPALWEAL